MINIIKFPFNSLAIARLDNDNVIHNHRYHYCPIGKVSGDIIFDKDDNPIGSVDKNGVVYSHHKNNTPIGKTNSDGFIYENDILVGRIDNSNPLLAGAAYLLLIHNNRI
ncbi:MAG: hypothetical protein RR942_09560 [Romboutsia sp.]